MSSTIGFFLCAALVLSGSLAQTQNYDYRLLATSRTSTMEKEMNEAASAGYLFGSVMGGETGMGGKDVVAPNVSFEFAHAKL